MKKFFPIIIITFFVTASFLASFVFAKAASPTISVKSSTATSATLAASGLIPGVTYQFKSSPLSLIGDETDQTEQVIASSSGTAGVTFSNLILRRDYYFTLFEYNTNTQTVSVPSVARVTFKIGSIFGPVIISMKNQTSDSVTIVASGMIPSITYQFKAAFINSSSGDQTKQVVASSSGTAEVTFSNLVLHRTYRFYLFEYDTENQMAKTPPVSNTDEFEIGSNFGPVLFSVDCETATSASLIASGLIPGITYQFKSSPLSLVGDETNQTTQIVASSSGTAGVTFSNLILHRSYHFNLFEYNTKTQTAITPPIVDDISFEAGQNTLSNLCQEATSSTGSSTTTTNTSTSTNSNIEFHGLVPVCNTEIDSATGTYTVPCDFNMIMAMINKVITFLLFVLATPLFALILIYVGWIYLSSGGNDGAKTKAKTILKNAFFGYLFALVAWLIVKTILATLGFNGDTYLSSSIINIKHFI